MRRRAPSFVLAASLLALSAPLLAAAPAPAPAPATLVGRSVLPADTFVPGPTSGRHLGAAVVNGKKAPFEGLQPVQGFSAVLDNGDGTFLLCGDNGFGALENSADHRLRVYTVKPRFRTAQDQAGGGIEVLDYIELHDPDRHVPYPITAQFTKERILTGADLDIEAIQRAPDGTLWFGDEFGPFLVHTDARGKVLEPPFSLPDLDRPGQTVRSPQNPFLEEAAAIRVMNALRADAQAHKVARSPAFSPFHLLLDDRQPALRAPERPAGVSSKVHAVAGLQAGGHRVVPWTVNEPARMAALLRLGVDGLISDHPERLYAAVAAHDANGDGKPGDFLLPDGRIDADRFDAQGHRGARDLRPENTLPAFEAALDHLMPTLETDFVLTRDGIAVLAHDPELSAAKHRRLDGKPFTEADARAIARLTLSELQGAYAADRLLPDRPQQRAELALSPVAVAFSAERRRPHAYSMPTLAELFDFVAAYEAYYRQGPGRAHPRAAARWRNAAAVRFNVETKLNPAWEAAGLTPGPLAFARAVAGVVKRHGLEARTQVQSFDHRSLLALHREAPALQTTYLLGDHAPFAFRAPSGPAHASDAGEYPFRKTRQQFPARAQRSGGFEAMAISPDGRTLYPLLEKALTGDDARTLHMFAFDLKTRAYTNRRWRYRLEPGATSVPDFVMLDERQGLVIERDDLEGKLDAIKRIYRIEIGAPGTELRKTLVADLMRLRDPDGLSLPGEPGDVGLGATFALPYFTIEGLVPLGPRRLGVVTDNNYPFSVGRHVGTKAPDDSEFVVIETATPLKKP